MTADQSAPRRIPASELRADLSAYLGAVQYGRQPLAITRHGKVVAMLLPTADTTNDTTEEN